MNPKLILTIILVFAFSSYGQKSVSVVSTSEEIAASVHSVPCKSEDRLDGVRKLFVSIGASEEDIEIQKFNKDKVQNLVVKLKGKTDETIVIGAHYDKTADGCGAIDNWTGISIIAHTYKTFSKLNREKTLIFVAFDQEEKGLIGSEEMVRAIPVEARKQYCAMVNLDSFGFTMPYALREASSNSMIKIAKTIGKENGMNFTDVSIPGADSDSSSFKNKKIPAITFNALDEKWRDYLHTSNDQLKKINMESVYIGYRFVLAFLSKLDNTPCADLQK